MFIDIQHKSTFWFSMIGILSILLLIPACNNSRISKLDDRDAKYVGKIKISAGDHIDYISNDTLGFLAYPINVALFTGVKGEDKRVMIVGKSIKKEQKIGFKPFALMKYLDELDEEKELVIARPLDEDLVTAKIDDYFEFISIYYGIQKVIETWVRNEKGYGSVKSLTWSNESAAAEYLDF